MRSLLLLWRLLVRMQVTPVRVLGLSGLGLLVVGIAYLAGRDESPLDAVTAVLVNLGLGIAVPLATLWLATSSVGDLVEDRLLVYLRLKPVPRWQLPVAAIAATVVVVAPVLAGALALAAVVAGQASLAPAAIAAAVLACLGYAAVFVALAFVARRALWWGLLYVLVWENAVANAVSGAARLSLASYPQSLVARAGEGDFPFESRSPLAATAVPLVLAFLAAVLATWRYQRAEVD